VATFRYVAVDPAGLSVRGETEAESPGALASLLSQRGFRLVRAERRRARDDPHEARVSRREVVDFTLNLATLERSGIPLYEGLSDLAEEAAGTRMGRVLRSLRDGVGRGETLSDAMASHPTVFPSILVEVVRAGERSGALAEVLDRLGHYLEWRDGLRSKLRQVFAYPMVLGGAVLGLVVLLLVYLLPRLVGVYESAAAELPLPTRVVVFLSESLTHRAPIVLGFAVSLGATLLLLRRTARGRLFLSRAALRIPAFGAVVQRVACAQFASTLGTMNRAGIDLPTALRSTAGAIENGRMAQAVAGVGERVLAGIPLSEAVREQEVFPRLVPRLLAVGEKSGNLDDALGRLAQTYDREVAAAVRRFLATLEPVFTLLLGIVVGFVVLATLLPVFRLFEVIRR
jgi:type IV pilus assembly protein PilC